LNDIVARIKTRPDFVDDKKKESLLNFVRDVNNAESTDPNIQLLSSIIERGLREHRTPPKAYLDTFISELEKNDVAHYLPKIEFFINALDTEHFEALSKINGE